MENTRYYRMRPARAEMDGVHEQIRRTVSGLKRAQVVYFQNLSDETFPDQLQHVHELKLEPGARFTDVLSMNYLREKTGLFVSDRMKELLQAHTLHNATFFEATVYKRSEGRRYWLLYVLRAPDLIDYERSTFTRTAITGAAWSEPAEVGSHEQWKRGPPQLSSNIVVYQIQKAVLRRDVDLFRFPMSVYVHVSESLKESIEAAGLDGVDFHPPEREIYRA